MKDNSSYKKIVALLAFTVLALFGGLYFMYSGIKSKNQTIALYEQDVNIKNNQYEYNLSMKKMVEDIKPDVDRINSSIIPVGADVEFIEKIESMAKSRSLSIDIDSLNIVNDTKNASSTVAVFKIKAKTEGGWANTYLFMKELETMPIKIKINKFALQTSGEIDTTKVTDASKKWATNFEISVLEYK